MKSLTEREITSLRRTGKVLSDVGSTPTTIDEDDEIESIDKVVQLLSRISLQLSAIGNLADLPSDMVELVKATNALTAKITSDARTTTALLERIVSRAKEDKPRKWTFTVTRNRQGFIEEVVAENG